MDNFHQINRKLYAIGVKVIPPYYLEQEIRTCGPSNDLAIPNKVVPYPEYYNDQF